MSPIRCVKGSQSLQEVASASTWPLRGDLSIEDGFTVYLGRLLIPYNLGGSSGYSATRTSGNVQGYVP